MSLAQGTLTFKSAVCIIPPKAIWDQIQEIRQAHDKHVKRWPPHINLLYPFLPYENFSETALPTLTRALSTIRPFSIRLGRFSWFQHSRNSFTVWLKPADSPEESLANLERKLAASFPELGEQMRTGKGQFVPHLSVGQFKTKEQVESLVAEMDERFSESHPLEFEVTSVQLIARFGYHDPFRVIHDIPLGGEEPPSLNIT
ncbi:LigT-like protein [Basidiobolus meristosporus CBS 931.73]|uniref:LigT-like protein n=1 Tax=Basidiobolus meristosporus CBS 931.73 TaxID=1314790 RepID=A0A1Y1Y4J1_9FUNG|nr:LigT-like protein [Basidiobolus meristosporus CBS 931.73]|eukprot:ORX92941.1 LigT-like protein [Basidiobolus meristosporus CBS 931.73]